MFKQQTKPRVLTGALTLLIASVLCAEPTSGAGLPTLFSLIDTFSNAPPHGASDVERVTGARLTAHGEGFYLAHDVKLADGTLLTEVDYRVTLLVLTVSGRCIKFGELLDHYRIDSLTGPEPSPYGDMFYRHSHTRLVKLSFGFVNQNDCLHEVIFTFD